MQLDFLRYVPEAEGEKGREVVGLKKKSDARISSNPCANLVQWSLQGPPAAKGCLPFLSILWSTYEGSGYEKKKTGGEQGVAG